MRIKFKSFWLATAAAVSAVPISVFATNGYFDIGYGAAAHGMGGAGVAFPQDSFSQAANPASITDLKTRFDIGAAWFIPMRYSAIDDDTVGTGGSWSGVNNFLVPGMGAVKNISDKFSIGFAMHGVGLKVLYKPNFFKDVNTSRPNNPNLGVDMINIFIPITAAYKFNDIHSVGFSLIPGYQRFNARGLEDFDSPTYSAYPGHVSDMGNDFAKGLGARIGWLGHFSERLNIGLSVTSKVYMEKFSKYKGLFAEQGTFDIAANGALGIAWKAYPDLTVAFDIQRIYFSNVPSVGNYGPVPGGNLPTGDNRLGLNGGSGFGWKDQTTYKLGLNYQIADWAVRVGFNYGATPIPLDQLTFNLLAPATTEKHLTLGLTQPLGRETFFGIGKRAEITYSFVHAFKKTLSGQSVDGVAEISMFQNVFEGAYSVKF